MIILENPYVSEFLIETIKKNNFSVLDNTIAREYFKKEELTTPLEAIKKYNSENELFYTNSENSISWIFENLKNTKLVDMINLSKNKAEFRRQLKKIYPNYFFEEFDINELSKIETKTLKFPLILKPSVGFLSFGVYPINNEEEWKSVLLKLDDDLEKIKGVFPQNVVNISKFIVEEMIEGEEFALDAYFDENGKATILNIYQHPFFNDKDVSDRVYYTSKAIFKKYLKKFNDVLDKIGSNLNYKNFPFHLELRANEKEIIPIEINPLRFCGWCITDITDFSWKINPYEYFLKQLKPDWNSIIEKMDDYYYYFTIGDIPSGIKNSDIKEINYEKYLKNIQTPLDVRKIDYKTKPVFAIVFAKTPNLDEIKKLLELNMNEFIVK